jgi:tRNA pseudouridine32 synthase / 23S rRNA pseudouridine746 synthase
LSSFELHLELSKPTLALELLSQHCALSKAELKSAIAKGALWLTQGKTTQRFRRLKKTLPIGATLHFYYDANVLQQVPNTPLLIADQQHYSIWYKPYGMLCQGSKWSDHCTINRWAEQQLSRPAFIVHRLDRAATGLLIIAHSKTMAQAFSRMFELRQLEKCYQIIVQGDFQEQAQPTIVSSSIDDKPAHSEFSLLQYSPTSDQSLLGVSIKTGRKHQIRIHAKRLGFAVVGDRLHGQAATQQYLANDLESKNLQLCAVSLSFICPLTQTKQAFTLDEHLRPQLI